MVEIKNLHKSYKGFKVLNGLDMHINKGDVYGFLGKNGCGKTTTMNIICDIIPKDEGEITLGTGENEKIKIGYLPETPALFDYMNGYEYLRYIAACADYKEDIEKRISECLAITGMTEGGKRRIKGYSRGMVQRLGIAATIFNNPDLIILDEPTSALDPEGRAEVMSIIRNLTATGCTIILCTHILSDVERVANRIGIMKDGRLAAEGSIQEILDRYRSDSIELIPMNDDPDTLNLINKFPSSKNISYFGHSGKFVIETENLEEGMISLIKYLGENNIAVKCLNTSRPTLEQVYIDLVS